MPKLATWIRPKDEKWFGPFFAPHPELTIANACGSEVTLDDADGLLLTGGADTTGSLDVSFVLRFAGAFDAALAAADAAARVRRSWRGAVPTGSYAATSDKGGLCQVPRAPSRAAQGRHHAPPRS